MGIDRIESKLRKKGNGQAANQATAELPSGGKMR